MARSKYARSARGLAAPARTAPPLTVQVGFGRGGGGRGSGGGAGTDSTRGGPDHIVLKRIVEHDARLVEQAALIKRLEATSYA